MLFFVFQNQKKKLHWTESKDFPPNQYETVFKSPTMFYTKEYI